MDISSAYASLLANPREAYVQTTEGDIISWRQWVNLNKYKSIYVYPGSFNPLHEGHRSIYSMMGQDALFETSVTRWKKEPLSLEDLETRLGQFVGYAPVVITNVARMIDKIAVLRGCIEMVFEIGIDTLTRMVDDYGEIGIGGLGSRFIVYDRVVDGMVKTLHTELKVIPWNCMRGNIRSVELMKVSSTAIRNGNG